MTVKTRYILKSGKFGYYFFDKEHSLDLTLEMVLNRLNNYEKRIIKAHGKNTFLRKEIYTLKKDD